MRVLEACDAETPLTGIISEVLYGKRSPTRKQEQGMFLKNRAYFREKRLADDTGSPHNQRSFDDSGCQGSRVVQAAALCYKDLCVHSLYCHLIDVSIFGLGY